VKFNHFAKKGPDNMGKGFFEKVPKFSPDFYGESYEIVKKIGRFGQILAFFLDNYQIEIVSSRRSQKIWQDFYFSNFL
jgi:hypothetical protein